MCMWNLVLLFVFSVFQMDGWGEYEVWVLQEFIDGYIFVFDIDFDQVVQIDLEVSFIIIWKDVQLFQVGDFIMEVYIEQQFLDNCVILKVFLILIVEELINQVLEMWGIVVGMDLWVIFEICEYGELEWLLYFKEKVLEQVL